MPGANITPLEIASTLRRGLGDGLEYCFVAHSQVVARVKKEIWKDAARFVRDDPLLACTYFSWLSAIDWTEQEVADAEAAVEESGEAEEDQTSSAEAEAAGQAPQADAEKEGSASGSATEDPMAASTPSSAPVVDENGVAEYFQPSGELFEVVCHLISPERGVEITLKAAVSKEEPEIDSLTEIFRGADWHERECHEMFGIIFKGHPNLVRLYLPEEFEGHPLRKTYLLGARLVKPWPGNVDVEEIPPELEPRLEALARGEEGG
jgi:NADH:ubiquinone oxidoreductase subunit C